MIDIKTMTINGKTSNFSILLSDLLMKIKTTAVISGNKDNSHPFLEASVYGVKIMIEFRIQKNITVMPHNRFDRLATIV